MRAVVYNAVWQLYGRVACDVRRYRVATYIRRKWPADYYDAIRDGAKYQ